MEHKSIDDMPNFLMVNDVQENPEKIIQDYLEMLVHLKDDQQGMWNLLEMFFDDVNAWSVRQMMIDQIKVGIGNLELFDKMANEFIDEDVED